MGYDAQLALDLAQACAQAYTDDMTGVVASYSGCVGRVIMRQRPSSANEYIVAFRGTRPDKLLDWLADGDFILVPAILSKSRCEVHSGFRQALNQIKGRLDDCLNRTPRARLYVTGHSLGGAMAAIYAASRQDIDGLHTFGQPRTGDGAFCSLLDRLYGDRYWRVVNDRDVVPRVPEEIGGYTHGGRLAMFDHSDRLGFPERMGMTSLDLAEDIADHSIERYVALLKTMQTGQPAQPLGASSVVAS